MMKNIFKFTLLLFLFLGFNTVNATTTNTSNTNGGGGVASSAFQLPNQCQALLNDYSTSSGNTSNDNSNTPIYQNQINSSDVFSCVFTIVKGEIEGDSNFLSHDYVAQIFFNFISNPNNTASSGNEPFFQNTAVKELLVAFNYACNEIFIALIAIFGIYYLINTTHDGSIFGERNNTFWKVGRILFVIFMVTPMPSFNYLSLMQLIVMGIIFLGILSADVIWVFMSIGDVKLGVDYNGMQSQYKPELYKTVSNNVDNNILLHVCDIQQRKNILLNNYSYDQMTKSKIESQPFYACVTSQNATSGDLVSVTGDGLTFTPENLYKTNQCEDNFSINTNNNINCGAVNFNYKGSDFNKFVDNVETNYQPELRKIAKDVIHYKCEQKIDTKKSNIDNYYRNCAAGDIGSFSYNKKGVIDTYSDEGIVSQQDLKNEIISYKDKVFNDLSQAGQNYAQGVLESKDSFRAEKALLQGFTGSGGFLFDNAQKYNEVKNNFKAPFQGFSVFLNDNNEGNYSWSQNQFLSESDFKNLISGLSQNVQNNKTYLQKIMDGIFVGIKTIEGFNNINSYNTDGLSNKTCEDDFSVCSVVLLNPVNNIIKKGVDIADSVTGWTMALYGVSYLSDMAMENMSLENVSGTKVAFYKVLLVAHAVSSFVGSILFVQAIIAYLMIYLIPLIVFVYFISGVLGWITSAIEAILIINFWLMLHLFPTQEEGFAGRASHGYNLLLSVLTRPSFIIFGMFAAFAMMSIMIAFVNVSFGVVLNSFSIFQNPNSPLEFFYNLVINILYFITIMYTCFRSAKAIYKVPRALISWIGFVETGSDSFNNIFEQYKNVIFKNIKRFVVII